MAARTKARKRALDVLFESDLRSTDPATTLLAWTTRNDPPVPEHSDRLVRLFVAGLCGLCYGTRQIVRAMHDKGIAIDTIVVSGGAARSALLRRILADATGSTVALPVTAEPVLLGGAMLGAVASGSYPSLKDAAAAMCRIGEEIAPAGGRMAEFHARKFAAYETLKRAEREVRLIMQPEPTGNVLANLIQGLESAWLQLDGINANRRRAGSGSCSAPIICCPSALVPAPGRRLSARPASVPARCGSLRVTCRARRAGSSIV